jgi:hypothetical protein
MKRGGDKEGGNAQEFAKLENSMRLVRDSYGQAQSAGGGAGCSP